MKRCCCDCCTVRTGTLIIGILSLIGSIYEIASHSFGTTLGFHELDILGDPSARETKYPELNDEQINEHIRTWKFLIATCLAMLPIDLVQLCLTIALIHGVSKDNPRSIVPWYYFNLVMFVISVIGTAGYTVWISVNGQHLVAFFVAITLTLCFWLVWHFLSVVKNYIDELRSGYRREVSVIGTSNDKA